MPKEAALLNGAFHLEQVDALHLRKMPVHTVFDRLAELANERLPEGVELHHFQFLCGCLVAAIFHFLRLP